MHNDAQHLSPLPQRPNVPNVPAHIPQPLRDCFAAQHAAFQKQRCPSLAERRADLRALHRLLVDHREALVDAVNRARPSAAKGQYFKNLTVASTMGPGIRVEVAGLLARAAA